MSEIVDYHLLQFFKHKLNETISISEKLLFKSQFACQTKAGRQLGMEDAVFLLKSDKKRALFFGTNHCKSPWICPVCSARVMAKHKKKIDAAIQAMKAKNQVAMMITFTIPHNQWYSCEDAIQIVKNSMGQLMKRAYQQKQQQKGKKFENNAWSRMFRSLEFKQYIRAMEFTWGKNGWHPHYHSLFFTPKHKLQLAKDYEENLNELWLKIVKQETKKQFYKSKSVKYSKDEINGRVDEIFDRMESKVSCFISKNEQGEIAQMESGAYIAGWGADNELTGSRRKTARAANHFTPMQMLEIAAGYSQADNLSPEKAWDLFKEFAICTKRNNLHRMKFSSPKGETLKSIIDKWLQTNAATEYLKKNYIEKWDVVCWFTKEQWFKISELNRDIPMLANILYLAYDSRLLREFLESFEIFAFDNFEHSHQFHVEDIMNGVAA